MQMFRQAGVAALVLCGLLATRMVQGKFVVETHSLRIREPAGIAGEFSLAIGDVSTQSQLARSVCLLLSP